MKAIILAAGKGERIRDLVSGLPKPMIAIDGKPILQQNIEWLARSGVTDLYVNLHHLPDRVTRHFGDGDRFGVQIHYSYEPELLGTAGAVRKILTETPTSGGWEDFLVVYGDNQLTNFNLKELMRFHADHKSFGTVSLFYEKDVLQSGIAVLDQQQRIVDFIEKPRPAQVVSHWVNAGIYILSPQMLDYIPEGFSDFGHDVFPAVLAADECLMGWVSHATLTAIDTPELLAQAHEKGVLK